MDKNRARALRKSVRYPAYQLSAYSDGTPDTADSRLVLGVLHILEWARTKFREFEIPKAFLAPPPEDYLQVRLSDLESAHINEGYIVDTVCMPDHHLWAFRLIEPDLSVMWQNGEAVSAAVPGRIFETNIAFSVSGARVRCGVNVMVSEPEGVETPSRVFCPACVRQLAKDAGFGLISGYQIQDQLYELRTRDKLKMLRDYLEYACLPAVIFCEAPQRTLEPEREPATPAQFKMPSPGALPILPDMRPSLRMSDAVLRNALQQRQEPFSETPSLPPYIEKFVRSRIGYVHTFYLPNTQLERFGQMFRVSPEGGGALFAEPKRFGGGIRVFPGADENGEAFGKLMELSRDYLRGKPVVYEQISFLNDAKLLQTKERKEAANSSEEIIALYEERISALESAHANALMVKNETIDRQEKSINRLTEQLDSSDERMEGLREEYRKKLALAEEREKMMVSRMKYLESLRERPNSPKDLARWAEGRFAGRLVIHSRAKKMLQALSPKEIDMQLLCDSLEYLAFEYRDQKAGLMTREKADMLCAQKYNRPFVIAPCGSTSVEMFPEDYKITYDLGQNGAPRDVPLDWHLKIGNTAENLIRIYFLFDDRKKLVVVGSLPRHLRVSQIQG